MHLFICIYTYNIYIYISIIYVGMYEALTSSPIPLPRPPSPGIVCGRSFPRQGLTVRAVPFRHTGRIDAAFLVRHSQLMLAPSASCIPKQFARSCDQICRIGASAMVRGALFLLVFDLSPSCDAYSMIGPSICSLSFDGRNLFRVDNLLTHNA